MPQALEKPTLEQSPCVLLETYIAAAAARQEPVPVDSEEGQRLYRALAQHVWAKWHRPVLAHDICDLWVRIDSLKRGSALNYAIHPIHFWAADFSNALGSESVHLDPDSNQRLAAWLDEWPNVCILGQTGRGKSSTINRLFGLKVADISHHEACTKTVSDYRLVTGNFLGRPTGVVLWDAPGYGDDHLMSWDKYVKLYRRLARRCDVVIFMLDNDRHLSLDSKMFRRLKKRVPELERKLVVVLNKADLFHPCEWNAAADAPSEAMRRTIEQRTAKASVELDLHDAWRVVPISALKNWNLMALLNAMVAAAGSSKGGKLLRAVNPDLSGTKEQNKGLETENLAQRFGLSHRLRMHFRDVINLS